MIKSAWEKLKIMGMSIERSSHLYNAEIDPQYYRSLHPSHKNYINRNPKVRNINLKPPIPKFRKEPGPISQSPKVYFQNNI